MKIGPHLTKLSTNIKWHTFFEIHTLCNSFFYCYSMSTLSVNCVYGKIVFQQSCGDFYTDRRTLLRLGSLYCLSQHDRKELKMEVVTTIYSSFQSSNCKHAKSLTARFPILDCILFRLDCTFWLECTLNLYYDILTTTSISATGRGYQCE